MFTRYTQVFTGWVILASISMTAQPSFGAPPPGYVDASTFGFNATDATSALQSAINTGQNVYVPNMGTPWYVTPIELNHSNQTIQFQSGTVVEAKPGAFLGGGDSLFTAWYTSNVKMIGYGATLKMHKNDYLQNPPYQPGEWRMGISLNTVSGFQIEGLTIKDTGGDGIYVGASQATYSQDVLIKNVVLDNNYRQGISVISAKNLTIDNAVIRNTSGTAPQAGIDFEPNSSNQVLQNITVKNSIIDSNASNGIMFYTSGISQVQVEIQNVTVTGNGASGVSMYQPLTGVTVKNSLFVSNGDYGVSGPPVTWDLILNGPPRTQITNSAFWGNADGTLDGWVQMGSGSKTNVQPLFYSTDPNNPWYMYLDPSVAAAIKNGADNGGYMGARPIYGTAIPEPATGGLVCIAAMFLMNRRMRGMIRP